MAVMTRAGMRVSRVLTIHTDRTADVVIGRPGPGVNDNVFRVGIDTLSGGEVCWKRIGGEWVTGHFVGLAPGDPGGGDPFVAVDAPNGRVHIRLSALSW